MTPRVAIVVSHPIQHFCPLYAAWYRSDAWETHVFFGSRAGLEPYHDINFGERISWRGLGLERFAHTFLNGENVIPVDWALDASSLEHHLEAFRPTAILSYGYSQRLQRRAQVWAFRNRSQIIFFSDSELRHRRPAWKQGLKRLWLPGLMKRVDTFVVTGNANEEYYRSYGVSPDKFVKGSYPIDRQLFGQACDARDELRRRTRERLGIPLAAFVVAMVGKLVPWKRQFDVVEAVANLRTQNAVALIVGSGAMREPWEQRARRVLGSRAVFTGFVPADCLPEYYAAADVYVHASEREPHSVAVSEAIYMGLPVVVSDRCGSYGSDDDVRPGTNGFVYQCGNTKELSSIIGWLICRPALVKALSIASRDIAWRQQAITYDELPRALSSRVMLRQAMREEPE
jgi:glycosyltransferase involved in cell wall biosynthesis